MWLKLAVLSVAVLGLLTPRAAAQDAWPASAFRDPGKAAPAARRPPPAAVPRRATQPQPTAPSVEAAETARPPSAPREQLVRRPADERGGAPPGPGTVHDADPAQPAPRAAAASGPAQPWLWRIFKTQWAERDEKAYEEFVQKIGESRCRTMHACLAGADSNPLYRASNPPGMHFYADCADLPYMLRAYFAWKNGLPFSYATAMTPLGASNDIRYTARGNHVTQRRDLVEAGMDARKLLPQIMSISSAQYRTPPNTHSRLLPDHYPVRVSRESIKPGTVIYDPNGHVAVVYKVTPEGRIHFIDTHPDNTLTRGVYGKAFVRATPSMGAGFKRWRPLRLVGAHTREDGSLVGGRIELAPDREIADWSDEQFYGNEGTRPLQWQKGRFVVEGEVLEYYDFVRKRLAKENFRYDPVEETRSMVRALCEDIKYRVDAVEVAVKAGIHKRPQPDRLPNNIYGTDGDWETYSTPSRDARLKTAFKELRDEVARFLDLAAAGSPKISYAGDNLRRDLRDVYAEESRGCRISYLKSDGGAQDLGFEDVRQRLFRLSFDPYHCIERRWGAEGAELAACSDGPVKQAWYAAEQRLRNQIDRTYDVRMGFGIADLQRKATGSGVDAPPDVDVLGLLADKVSSAAPAGGEGSGNGAGNGARPASQPGPQPAAN